MDKFEKLNELQSLLLSMETNEDISKVKNFIDENQFFKNEKKSMPVIRLIGSVVYIKPKLLNNAVTLLNLFDNIPISDELLENSYIENQEINARKLTFIILLSLTKHKKQGNSYHYEYDKYIYPIKYFQKGRNVDDFYFYCPLDYDIICNMSDDQKIQARNTLYSINPIVQLIKDDNIDAFQDFISKNNYDIEKSIPHSSFEIHIQLLNAKPIEYAAYFGSINCFKFLLMKDNNINYINLLVFAFCGGNIDIIHIIENESHNESIKSNHKLLYCAILFMNNDLIDYVVHSYHIKIDAESYIKCIYASNYDAMLKLRELDDDNKINQQGNIGSAPIDIAAFEGYLDFLKYFLTIKDIDVSQYNSYGKTILQSAARSNRIYVVKYIVKHNLVDKNDVGDYGSSAFDIAYNYNCSKVIDFFEGENNLENEEESN